MLDFALRNVQTIPSGHVTHLFYHKLSLLSRLLCEVCKPFWLHFFYHQVVVGLRFNSVSGRRDDGRKILALLAFRHAFKNYFMRGCPDPKIGLHVGLFGCLLEVHFDVFVFGEALFAVVAVMRGLLAGWELGSVILDDGQIFFWVYIVAEFVDFKKLLQELLPVHNNKIIRSISILFKPVPLLLSDIGLCLYFILQPERSHVHPSAVRKREVNIDWGQNKGRQVLYKEVPLGDEPLLMRQHEVLQKVSLRVYCDSCERQVTRYAHILTPSEYYCVGCFAGLEEWPEEYVVRQALNRSVEENSPWELMDEVILASSLKQWGYGNWTQIREHMHYNGAVFSQDSIEHHFEQAYLRQPDHLPALQTENLHPGGKRTTIHRINLINYRLNPDGNNFYQEPQMHKHSSKGEKKVTSLLSIPSVREEEGAAADTRRQRPGSESKLEGAILGYNPKRKQFEFGEYDTNAECIIADLQFSEDDSTQQRKLKLQMIDDYNRRLTDRLKRRQFVVEHRLLDSEYSFYQQNRIDSEVVNAFQPLMQWTHNHKEHQSLIQNYNLMRRYEKYVINLTRIRHRVAKEGKLEQAYQFMKKKREKFISKLQRSYGQHIQDPKRQIYVRDGSQMVQRDEKNGVIGTINSEVVQALTDPPLDFLAAGDKKIGQYKITPLS